MSDEVLYDICAHMLGTLILFVLGVGMCVEVWRAIWHTLTLIGV